MLFGVGEQILKASEFCRSEIMRPSGVVKGNPVPRVDSPAIAATWLRQPSHHDHDIEMCGGEGEHFFSKWETRLGRLSILAVTNPWT